MLAMALGATLGALALICPLTASADTLGQVWQQAGGTVAPATEAVTAPAEPDLQAGAPAPPQPAVSVPAAPQPPVSVADSAAPKPPAGVPAVAKAQLPVGGLPRPSTPIPSADAVPNTVTSAIAGATTAATAGAREVTQTTAAGAFGVLATARDGVARTLAATGDAGSRALGRPDMTRLTGIAAPAPATEPQTTPPHGDTQGALAFSRVAPPFPVAAPRPLIRPLQAAGQPNATARSLRTDNAQAKPAPARRPAPTPLGSTAAGGAAGGGTGGSPFFFFAVLLGALLLGLRGASRNLRHALDFLRPAPFISLLERPG